LFRPRLPPERYLVTGKLAHEFFEGQHPYPFSCDPRRKKYVDQQSISGIDKGDPE
jgi:hypothetical protein